MIIVQIFMYVTYMYAHTYTRTYIKCYKNFYFTISQIKKANDQGDQEGWETSGVMFHLLRQQIELRTSDKLEALVWFFHDDLF